MKCCRLLFLILPFSVFSQAWEDHELIDQAQVSVAFLDVQTGQTKLAIHEDKVLNPASTIKLLTCLTMLDEYGESYQFETRLLYDGELEKDGTLKGNLIVQGTGDPSLGSSRYGKKNSTEAFLNSCVAYAQKAGITCIDGNIIIDASAFGSDCVPHSWPYNDLGNYYAAGAWAININENSYKLNFHRKGKSISNMTYEPSIPYVYFTNELELGPPDSGDQAYIFCSPYQNHAYIRGSIPRGNGIFSIRGSMPNAPLFLGVSLQKKLAERGISSQKVEVEMVQKKKGKLIHVHKGIPLGKMVTSALQKSINLYCEAFLLKLGNGNRAKGIDFITNSLKDKNILSSSYDFQMSDGSGLSQRNYISAMTQAKFLRYHALNNKKINQFLARNGYDGTLKNKFTSSSLKGKIYGKSGSMGNVRAYTGILETKRGSKLSFSIMVNNYMENYRKIDRHIERLLIQATSL